MQISALKKQQETLQHNFNQIAQSLLLQTEADINNHRIPEHFEAFEHALRPIQSLESAHELHLRREGMIRFLFDLYPQDIPEIAHIASHYKNHHQDQFLFLARQAMDLLEKAQIPALMQETIKEDSQLLQNLSQR